MKGGEPTLTERTRQDKELGLKVIDLQERFLDAQEQLTSAERTRQGEELVKAARAERMPGLVEQT